MILATLLLAATFSRPLERVSTTDPAEAQSAYDARVVQLIYESPLAIDYKARPYKLAPGYCELPEVSPDGRVYRFTVREAPRNAADMVRSLKRLYEPTCPNGWLVKDVESVAAADARTVEIRLKRRVRHFPWLMATPGACVVGADGRLVPELAAKGVRLHMLEALESPYEIGRAHV